MSQLAPGARSSSRRIRVDALAVLALVLPLLTFGTLLLVRPDAPAVRPQAPTRTALTQATLVCPRGLPGGDEAQLGTAQPDVSGKVEVRNGRRTSTVPLESGRLTGLGSGSAPTTVTGEGDLAPGLVGGRAGSPRSKGVAATGCPYPTPDQWFTGVGAGAKHASVLELVNPDAGPALADITVLGPTGPLDVPRLRGVAVPGRSSVRLDLAAVAPRRGELTLRVATSRGRLAASVLDSVDELGAGRSSQDWLAAQAAPSTDNLLLGLPTGEGTRTLLVANPGDDEVRVQLKVVSDTSTFAPAGLEPIRVAPGSTERVSVAAPVAAALRAGGLGLELTSSGPVTASLRTFAGGDLAETVASTPVEDETAAVLPGGRAQLLLAGAGTEGRATVTGWTGSGRRVLRTTATVVPDRGTVVRLPPAVRLLVVAPRTTPLRAGVLVTGRGATVLPLVPLVRNGLVPSVRPGLS
jgi:hypothetical protein